MIHSTAAKRKLCLSSDMNASLPWRVCVLVSALLSLLLSAGALSHASEPSANGKAVVSECGPRTEIDEDIRRAMVAVPYEHLVTSCVALARDEPRRRELEKRAFEVFAKRDQAKILRETIAATDMPTFG